MFKGGFLGATNSDGKDKNEPWQARPPPQVESQFRREVTRPLPRTAGQPDEFPSLSAEEIELLGLKPEQVNQIGLYKSSDSDTVRFLDWDVVSGERRAVFRVEDEENPLGYRFSRLRYGELLTTATLAAMMWRPDEDLKALRAFNDRFGQPIEADLSDDVAHLKPSP